MQTDPRWWLTFKSAPRRSLVNDISVTQGVWRRHGESNERDVFGRGLTVALPARFVRRQRENGLYQWRMCAAPGIQVRFQSEPNRTGPVQFISTVKTERRETRRVQLVQLHPQSVSFKTSAPWIRHLIYPAAPSSASTSIPFPLLLLLLQPSPHPSRPSPPRLLPCLLSYTGERKVL